MAAPSPRPAIRSRTAATRVPPPSKIDRSSLIDLDLAARGVAEVIVFLKPAQGASLAAAVARPGAAYAAPASSVMSCFTDAPTSHDAALRQAQRFATAGAAASARIPVRRRAGEDAPALLFRNLGVMVGNVDRAGLDALENHQDVAKVMATPPLRLIRPRRVAAVAAPKRVTWGITALGVRKLWDKGFQGQGVLIGHLDTGVDAGHRTLEEAVDRFAMINDFGEVDGTDAFDSDDHGTHTAGTIAGRPVGKTIIGVAPEAKLASAMVIEGGKVVARVLGGIDWAIDQEVRILSMSLGFPGFHTFFNDVFDVLRGQQILPVIAVGNEAPGTSRSPGNYAESLSVGAVARSREVADFSSSQRFARTLDPLVPDLVAPGVSVISAKPGGGFQSMDGTSMATPHIAGLAAVLFSAFPQADANQVEAAIFGSCRLSDRMDPERANRGMPNAVNAFDLLRDAVT